MKGKLFTVIGIVLLFGYFIMESFRTPSSADPNAVVMVGKDTLGRDWGAQADARDRQKAEMAQQMSSGGGDGAASGNIMSGSAGDDKLSQATQQQAPADPFTREKLNSADYTSIQAADGREIITGYSTDGQEGSNQVFQTRHQQERNQPSNNVTEEPTIPVRE